MIFPRRSLALALAFTPLLSSCKDEGPQQPKIENTPIVPKPGGPAPKPGAPFVRPNLEGAKVRAEIVIDTRDPESLYLAGQQEFISGKEAEATEHFRQSILLKPSAKAYHAMGDALLSQVKFSDAAAAFKDAVRLEPGKRLSWMRLGRCLINASRPTEAIDAFHKAQELQPEDPEAYREEAEALIAMKSFDEAVTKLEKASALKETAKDRKIIGQVRSKQGQLGEAAKAFNRSAELHPDAGIYSELGDVLVRNGDLDGAARALEQAASLDPKDPWPWEAVGEIRLKQKDPEKARAAFASSIKVKDRSPPHLSLGRLALAEKKKDEAQKELDLAMAALGGDNPQEVREVATFAMEVSKPSLAEKLLALLAGEEDPKKEKKDPMLFVELARARAALKDAKGAKEACGKAKELLPKDDKTKCP